MNMNTHINKEKQKINLLIVAKIGNVELLLAYTLP